MKPSLKVKPETEIQDWSDLLEVPEGVFGCFLSYCWAVYFLYNFFFSFYFLEVYRFQVVYDDVSHVCWMWIRFPPWVFLVFSSNLAIWYNFEYYKLFFSYPIMRDIEGLHGNIFYTKGKFHVLPLIFRLSILEALNYHEFKIASKAFLTLLVFVIFTHLPFYSIQIRRKIFYKIS